MPTYEYECLDCKKSFEVQKSIKEHGRNEECAYCESRKTKQIISPTNFKLTGEGFHSTDYPQVRSRKDSRKKNYT